MEGDDELIVGGAFHAIRGYCTSEYCHVIQFFSLTEKAVTHSIVLTDKITYKPVYSIVPVKLKNKARYIVFAHDYTAVISHPPSYQCQYIDKYVVPNAGCAAILCEEMDSILLVGGEPKPSSPHHFLYKANVMDILTDTGSGWEQLQSQWNLGKCWMHGYDTTSMAVHAQ